MGRRKENITFSGAGGNVIVIATGELHIAIGAGENTSIIDFENQKYMLLSIRFSKEQFSSPFGDWKSPTQLRRHIHEWIKQKLNIHTIIMNYSSKMIELLEDNTSLVHTQKGMYNNHVLVCPKGRMDTRPTGLHPSPNQDNLQFTWELITEPIVEDMRSRVDNASLRIEYYKELERFLVY